MVTRIPKNKSQTMDKLILSNHPVQIAYSRISLGYFKQGDDCHHALSHNTDGTVNVKESLLNHIRLLQHCVKHLQKIHDAIPNNTNLKLSGDTHCICLSGDTTVINSLVAQDLVELESDYDEEDSPENNYSFGGDATPELYPDFGSGMESESEIEHALSSIKSEEQPEVSTLHC